MGDKEVSSPPSPVPRSWLSVWPGRWIKPSPWKGCSWHIKSRLGRRVLPQLPGPPNPFQLNKKLFNAFHKSNQTSPSRSLLHLMQPCSLMPRTMPGQLKNHDLDSKNNEEDFFFFFITRRGHGACFAFLLRGDLKNYVLCYPSVDPLIIVIQVMLKFLSKLGKGALSMQNILLYGNESSMWQLLNSSEPPKQMLLLMVGEEVFAASKSKSNAYLCLYSVCLALVLSFFFHPSTSFCGAGPTRRTFPASAD